MQLCQPRVLERLVDINALARVKLEHLLHQIDRLGVGVRELLAEVGALQSSRHSNRRHIM
jgi:hypothetical protein